MSNDNNGPKSHIYIAGSKDYYGYFKNTGRHTYKIGRSNNLIDRFITAPDSYYHKCPYAGMYPIAAWLWVPEANKIEKRIITALDKSNSINRADLKDKFPIGYKEISCSNSLELDALIAFISTETKRKSPNIRFNGQSDVATFESLITVLSRSMDMDSTDDIVSALRLCHKMLGAERLVTDRSRRMRRFGPSHMALRKTT